MAKRKPADKTPELDAQETPGDESLDTAADVAAVVTEPEVPAVVETPVDKGPQRLRVPKGIKPEKHKHTYLVEMLGNSPAAPAIVPKCCDESEAIRRFCVARKIKSTKKRFRATAA